MGQQRDARGRFMPVSKSRAKGGAGRSREAFGVLLRAAKRGVKAGDRFAPSQKQIALKVLAEMESRAFSPLAESAAGADIKGQKAKTCDMPPEPALKQARKAGRPSGFRLRDARGRFLPNPDSLMSRLKKAEQACARNAAVKCLETLLLKGMVKQKAQSGGRRSKPVIIMASKERGGQEAARDEVPRGKRDNVAGRSAAPTGKINNAAARGADMSFNPVALANSVCQKTERKGAVYLGAEAADMRIQENAAEAFMADGRDFEREANMANKQKAETCDMPPEPAAAAGSQAQGASSGACPRGGAKQSFAAVSANLESEAERANMANKQKTETCDAPPEPQAREGGRTLSSDRALPSAKVQIKLPPKLVPVFAGRARYRCAYGGRGSGKTRSFAKMAAIRGYQLACAGKSGLIVAGREFMNSLAESSLAEVKAAIAEEKFLAEFYDVGADYVRAKDRRIQFAFTGLRHNLDSLKSKARIHLLWADEAESISEAAWQKIIPTVREPGSEIWVTWNPASRASAAHQRFREKPPADAKIARLDWRDNPWFPQVLERERLADKELRPEHYPHIWEGDFVSFIDGAYYAAALRAARDEGRIGRAECDPLMSFHAFWDIGGAGARADATAIWIAQFIGDEIRVLDYYEAQGQPLARHIDWLRTHGYGAARMVLPHDGAARDRVHDVSFQAALAAAGFAAEVIPNQGAGAARLRIEAGRRLFGQMRFDEARCRGGLLALNAYREKRDAERNIGLGPEHDWASHAADAFGLMCIAYEAPSAPPPMRREAPRYSGRSYAGGGSWMAG